MFMKHDFSRLGLAGASLCLLTSCCIREPQLKDTEGPPSFASSVRTAPSVSFCELIRDPERYDKKIVRTQALFGRNMENGYLYDPACTSQDASVWVEFDPAYEYSDEAVKKKFMQTLC